MNKHTKAFLYYVVRWLITCLFVGFFAAAVFEHILLNNSSAAGFSTVILVLMIIELNNLIKSRDSILRGKKK